MINEKELNISNESFLKKDFYQIYPEILDIASKISERWDPQSSNESDPGVVLLKLLAFVADKNNYIIDKSILEAFMPSATQEDSMRKLCDMMGYNMKYYNSATTEVIFTYYGQEDKDGDDKLRDERYFTIPQFTVITSSSTEDNIYYTTLEEVTISESGKEQKVEAIEGQIQEVLVGSSNIILLSNLTDNKFYLPETQIAENGIFIYNDGDTNRWSKVENLNIISPGSKVYQFGFDSKKQLPYILFPNDIEELIGSGLKISYIRTKGINGNINFKTLSKLSSLSSIDIKDKDGKVVDSLDLSTEEEAKSLGINNANASTNGRDLESIDDAYNGFKKTVGTFETLVTCRDYANAIYRLVDSLNNPLISNIQVADIRNHPTRSNKVVTYDDFGLNTKFVVEKEDGEDLIDNFDLYFYPLGNIYSFYNKENYINSFKPGMTNSALIEREIEEFKTISHNIKYPEALNNPPELYCYKGYYDLNARITTKYKIGESEEKEILNNIYFAIYESFNARRVDFGEEIPYDNIYNVIKGADSRIKDVSLEEPEVSLKYMLADGSEEDLLEVKYEGNNPLPRIEYLKMLAKNILAGKISLFKYNTSFTFDYGQSNASFYGNNLGGSGGINTVTELKTELQIPTDVNHYNLRKNEVVQFISPSLNTEITYPAYVNYYLVLGDGGVTTPVVIPNFINLGKFNNVANWRDAYDSAIATTGYGLYRIVSENLLSPENGFRIQNYTKYAPINEYSPNVIYYKLGSDSTGNYSEGKNAGVPYIPANSEYRLKSGDKLYINYTDTNDDVQNIEYDDLGRIVNGIRDKDYNKTILKSNFDLYDSQKYKDSDSSIKWRKISNLPPNLPGNEGNKGMFSLGSNEQIEIRDLVKTTVENKSLFAYWQLNNNLKTIPFVSNEYILKDNEYFMYTDQNKTGLVILGSGTKIIIDGLDPSLFTLSKPDSIKMEDVSSKGLGAFNDDAWCVLKIYNNNNITFQEMTVITLSEGDTLISLNEVATESGSEYLDNNFKYLSGASFSFNSGAQESLPDISDIGENWMVRSRLDLNVSPDLPQLISNGKDESTTPKIITQSIIINPSSDEEEILDGEFIKTNYILQVPGSDSINVKIFKVNEETEQEIEIDDFAIMSYEYSVIGYSEEESGSLIPLQIGNLNVNYTLLPKDGLNYYFPISIPTNNFGLIMIHYNSTLEEESGSLGASIESDGFNLSWYNDSTSFNGVLKEGINIIKIEGAGTELIIKRNDDAKGEITISNLSVVEGINSEFLALNRPSSNPTLEENKLLEILQPYNDIFFYNNPIEGSASIDVNNMSEIKSLYDYNNVCNDFVISELNASTFNKGIKIARSSRK